MADFQAQIKADIALNGPMRLDIFFGRCVSDYYANHHIFGAKGDFVTAPEISQCFGEVIGAWVVARWHDLGCPAAFHLIECGPGNGTLMADILRVTRHVPSFHCALRLCFIETSPALRARQKTAVEACSARDVQWCDDINDMKTEYPVILIANEFLDALSIRQIIYNNESWAERAVGVRNDQLVWGYMPLLDIPHVDLFEKTKPEQGAVFEFSPRRELFVAQVKAMIAMQKGAALFVDYGHGVSDYGDTVQAVKSHKFVDPLEYAGNADLTSHVDFEPLLRHCVGHCDFVKQTEFLQRNGIEARRDAIMKNASTAQRDDIEKAVHRLCHEDEMGTLFKVMECRWYP